MKILHIIDDKSYYHKEIEMAIGDQHEITTYSISSIQNEYEILQLTINQYEYINNSFDYVFIFAFPKQMPEYYLMITKYLTIKKFLFIDFVSETNLFSNISLNTIKTVINNSDKIFIFNEKIYKTLSKNNNKCILMNHFKLFKDTSKFIEYDNKNKNDILLSNKNQNINVSLNYNFYQIKSSSIIHNIIYNNDTINFIEENDINKMFICLYDNNKVTKEMYNIIYNGILLFIHKNYANKIYITNNQKICDTKCCIIYESEEDLIIQLNKIINSKNTYNSIRNNTFNTFKQISNYEIKKIINEL